jgi:response regulator RpfG family c-di-GMP phosphodiesterase
MPFEENTTTKILVIDDDPAMLRMVCSVLRNIGYDVFSAKNGNSGIEEFKKENPTLVITDIHMPDISGIDVLRSIKKDSPTTQVLVFSGVGTMDDIIEALRLGACDFLTKPFNLKILIHTVNRCVERNELINERINRQTTLERQVVERTAALTNTFYETVKALGRLTELRDPYTAGHQNRVALLAVGIGRELGLSQSELETIHVAGLLHDIGKAAVPVELLVKPSRLNEHEFELIKNHPQSGYDIIRDIPFVESLGKDVSIVVQQHHERLNGAGYPNGLSDVEIELESKILSVADVMEAMSSHRPYRPALNIDVAMNEIRKNRGVVYSPECVDACLELFAQHDNNSTILFELLSGMNIIDSRN